MVDGLLQQAAERKKFIADLSCRTTTIKRTEDYFKTANADQIVEHFMTMEHKFFGIRSEEDIQTLLTCYVDPDKSEYPAGSGWSFTRYYFPEAYATGSRLADFSSTVYALLKSVR
ncbi:hypothetical protein [Paenibacillus sp. FSL H7-0331]|uniref:hypothetical protein n=1 Tax=Paenibacillus sp. FSL H7-0331 TaxID=1920421 RepID=UPI00096E90B4|nr:hypothetical protein [Paenibacillus sp. FSL H7-0331]OMF11309.1 hypothetical protein BK127_25210 [Paenibacillus sp. FSL H7-0331]